MKGDYDGRYIFVDRNYLMIGNYKNSLRHGKFFLVWRSGKTNFWQYNKGKAQEVIDETEDHTEYSTI